MDILDKSLLQNPGYMAQRVAACELEIQKGMIGQREIIRQVMIAMLTGGMYCWRECQDWARPGLSARSRRSLTCRSNESSLRRT